MSENSTTIYLFKKNCLKGARLNLRYIYDKINSNYHTLFFTLKAYYSLEELLNAIINTEVFLRLPIRLFFSRNAIFLKKSLYLIVSPRISQFRPSSDFFLKGMDVGVSLLFTFTNTESHRIIQSHPIQSAHTYGIRINIVGERIFLFRTNIRLIVRLYL